MVSKAHIEAEHFLNNEKQFHLGILPTEQSNPRTRDLDKIFAADTANGIKTLLSVDKDIVGMAQRVLNGNEFRKMVDAGTEAVTEGKRIVFSGCGATGRLSILLESMWRYFFRDLHLDHPEIYSKVKQYENSVFSIMTGGDYALIKAVEFFEDYEVFGRQQVKELNIVKGDILIAITEGGETSSVLGTVAEAADRGAKVFLLFNNPADILCKHIERSRQAIENPMVTVLDLYCGPMAIAGSTRMQATTSEQLIAGAALESILKQSLGQIPGSSQMKILNMAETDYARAFENMVDELLEARNLDTLGKYVELEKDIYRQKGLVTYFAEEFMLDIFTDTTERSPTFMLPPFRKSDDTVSPPSWAFVKNPLLPTPAAWEHVLGRAPRCLEWDEEMYRQMGASEILISSPPIIDETQILKFLIGNEEDESRFSRKPNMAVQILGSREISKSTFMNYKTAFDSCTKKFERTSSLTIGDKNDIGEYQVICSPVSTVLNLIERLAVKLTLNTISTGTMVMMGRVTSNWMSWVQISNKKLKDRGIRLISEICGLSYRDACYALHETIEELQSINIPGREPESPVQYTIRKIMKQKEG